MDIITYNLNGIRAAIKKGFVDWVLTHQADVICLQEVKAEPDQVDLSSLTSTGYNIYWNPSLKKGYSGVAVFSKIKPENWVADNSHSFFGQEGRFLRIDFPDFSILNVYFPSGSSGEIRQAVKMQFLEYFLPYIAGLRETFPKLLICGDFNICHQPIDIHNPVSNKKSSGFLPEERAWLTKFIDSGFIDTFRYFNPDPHHYTWWSQRVNARSRNLGWRIDYHMVSKPLLTHLKRSVILKDAVHSDHCPVLIELDFKYAYEKAN
jgi:exodeoxyribonuclease-3